MAWPSAFEAHLEAVLTKLTKHSVFRCPWHRVPWVSWWHRIASCAARGQFAQLCAHSAKMLPPSPCISVIHPHSQRHGCLGVERGTDEIFCPQIHANTSLAGDNLFHKLFIYLVDLRGWWTHLQTAHLKVLFLLSHNVVPQHRDATLSPKSYFILGCYKLSSQFPKEIFNWEKDNIK